MSTCGLGFQTRRYLVEKMPCTVHKVAEPQLAKVRVSKPQIHAEHEEHEVAEQVELFEMVADHLKLILLERADRFH